MAKKAKQEENQITNNVKVPTILKKKSIKELIAPSGINASNIDHLEIISNVKRYARSFYVSNLPRSCIFPELFRGLYGFGDINTSIYIKPIEEAVSQTELNRTITELETERIVAIDRGKINRESIIAQKRMETEQLRDEIAAGFNKLYEASVVSTLFAYSENDLKNAILLILKNALEKYEIDSNLLNIVPYEECKNEWFDKVILEDENKIVSNKLFSDYSYIYLENESFASMAVNDLSRLSNKGKQVEIIKGTFEDVLNKINGEELFSTCIYTENRELAYNFINLAQASNVFVNASLEEAEELENIEDEFYMKKKIMYPIN